MFLSHGVNELDELVSIHDMSSGSLPLSCPLCGKSLIARKGSQRNFILLMTAKLALMLKKHCR